MMGDVLFLSLLHSAYRDYLSPSHNSQHLMISSVLFQKTMAKNGVFRGKMLEQGICSIRTSRYHDLLQNINHECKHIQAPQNCLPSATCSI